MRSGWGERKSFTDERYLMFDCGPLGEGNHGHIDFLSFEMAAFGRSLIVDPGRYTIPKMATSTGGRAFAAPAITTPSGWMAKTRCDTNFTQKRENSGLSVNIRKSYWRVASIEWITIWCG
ncbi:MAG: heparinase II/III family protein [Calditrichia bacterium]